MGIRPPGFGRKEIFQRDRNTGQRSAVFLSCQTFFQLSRFRKGVFKLCVGKRIYRGIPLLDPFFEIINYLRRRNFPLVYQPTEFTAGKLFQFHSTSSKSFLYFCLPGGAIRIPLSLHAHVALSRYVDVRTLCGFMSRLPPLIMLHPRTARRYAQICP